MFRGTPGYIRSDNGPEFTAKEFLVAKFVEGEYEKARNIFFLSSLKNLDLPLAHLEGTLGGSSL